MNKCSQCGICCKLFLINLTEVEYKSGGYKTQFEQMGVTEDFEEAQVCGANIIDQKMDGSCIYLEEGKCSIHIRRPQSCKNFFCLDPSFDAMTQKIKDYKKVNVFKRSYSIVPKVFYNS